MKILLLDIETAPNTAHVWGLWEQNVGLNQLLESSYVLCWAAKWLGSDTVHFSSVRGTTVRKMLLGIHALLEKADVVIHYNGTKFDIPTLNKEFLLQGIRPPAPFQQVDLLRVVKSRFKFPSNRLDYVAEKLGIGKKYKHEGHELWIKCMAGQAKAWAEMKTYNKHDVVLLEGVYHKLKPWIKGHANHSLYSMQGICCPNCSGTNFTRRGYAYTTSAKYVRCQCTDCGTWFRTGKSVAPKPELKAINV
jgi:hypothetical protein